MSSPDYEARATDADTGNTYEVTIQASDGGATRPPRKK